MTARCPHTLDEFVRFGLDGFDGHGVAGNPSHAFPALIEKDGRYGHDAQADDEPAVFGHVELAEFELAFIGFGELFHLGHQGKAGAALRAPEIHHARHGALLHFGLERFLIDNDHCVPRIA